MLFIIEGDSIVLLAVAVECRLGLVDAGFSISQLSREKGLAFPFCLRATLMSLTVISQKRMGRDRGMGLLRGAEGDGNLGGPVGEAPGRMTSPIQPQQIRHQAKGG